MYKTVGDAYKTVWDACKTVSNAMASLARVIARSLIFFAFFSCKEKIIFIERITPDRKLKASREGSK